MRHFLFSGNESPEEIKRVLLDNCEGVEEMEYTKQLSEDELAELRVSYVSNNVALKTLNEKLRQAKADHKEESKPIIEQNKGALHTLHTRHQQVSGKVYRMPNLESNMMEFVNEYGEIVMSRKLKPEEKQGRIFPIGAVINE